MTIKNMRIKKLENIDLYESPFNPVLTILNEKNNDSIFKAIGVILKNDSVVRRIVDIQDDTVIEAELEAEGFTYRIAATGSRAEKAFSYAISSDGDPPEKDFYHILKRSTEEENLSWFWPVGTERYSERFLFYRASGNRCSEEDFFALTGGIGRTRTFRACLSDYLKQCNPEQFIHDENLILRLMPAGNFIVEKRMPSQKVLLGESDRCLFEFLCFLKLNEFWGKIEEIRDFHHEKTPLMIAGLVNTIDVSKDLMPYLTLAQKQKRQIFVSTMMSDFGLPIGESKNNANLYRRML